MAAWDFISISVFHQASVNKTFLWSYILKEVEMGKVISDCLKFVGRKRNGQVGGGYWAQPIGGVLVSSDIAPFLGWVLCEFCAAWARLPTRRELTDEDEVTSHSRRRCPTLQGCLFQGGIIKSKLKTLTFCTTCMSDIYILHHFHQRVYFYYTHYSLLNAFQNTPFWWWMAFLLPIMNNSIILGSWKCIVYNLPPVALVTGLFGFCGVTRAANHSGTEISWGISLWGVERFHSLKSNPIRSHSCPCSMRLTIPGPALTPPRAGIKISSAASSDSHDSSHTKHPVRR